MKQVFLGCFVALCALGLSQGCSPAPIDETVAESATESTTSEPGAEATTSESASEPAQETSGPGPEPGKEPGPEPGNEPGPEAGPEAGTEPGPEAGPEAGPEPGNEPGPEAGPEPGPEPQPEPQPEPGPEAAPDAGSSTIPTNGAALIKWLQAGNYKSWAKESKVHGGGIHGQVLVYINAALDASLKAGNSTHTVGSASVKELYTGSNVTGYAVMVKVSSGAAASTWYWYEKIGSNVVADGTSVSLCTGCHSAGKDYFRTKYPLQ